MPNIQPYNAIFVKTLSLKLAAREYLENSEFVPSHISKNCDFDSLERVPTTFIDERLKPHFADVIWKCKCNGESLYFCFLFEHKSYIDRFIILQLLRYLTEGYLQQIDEYRKKQKAKKEVGKKTKQLEHLQLIIPIVLYHGKDKWQNRPFSDLFKLPDPSLKSYIPEVAYILNDLTKTPDKLLMALEFIYLRSTMLLLKHRNEKDFVLQYIREIFIFVQQDFPKPQIESFTEAYLQFITTTMDLNKDDYFGMVKDMPFEAYAHSLLGKERLEGRQEGRQEGKSIGLQKKSIEAILGIIKELPKLSNEKIAEMVMVTLEFVEKVKKDYRVNSIAGKEIDIPNQLRVLLNLLLLFPKWDKKRVVFFSKVELKQVSAIHNAFSKGDESEALECISTLYKNKVNKKEFGTLQQLAKEYVPKFKIM